MCFKFIFLLVISFTFVSIQPVLSQNTGNNDEKRSVVFLFDVSDSITKDDKKNFFEEFQKVLDVLSPGDEYVVLKIGKDSQLLSPVVEGRVFIPKKGMSSAFNEDEKRQNSEEVLDKVENFLNSSEDDTTSIISSLNAVNDYFSKKINTKKYIFIFSDMQEWSRYLKMSKEELNKKKDLPVKEYIHLKPNNMENSKVYILGVKTGEKYFEKVKRFWLDFFSQYKINVEYYQSRLINFSIP